MHNSHFLRVIDLVIRLFGWGTTARLVCDASELALDLVLLDTDCFLRCRLDFPDQDTSLSSE